MAKDKNSFVLYTDLIHTVDILTDEQAGKLFKHILLYVNDYDPLADDQLTQVTFEPIKQQLKRDLRKYEKRIKVAKDNGAKGGRPKNPNKPKITQPFSEKPKKAVSVNATVSVNANANATDSVKKKKGTYIEQFPFSEQFSEYWLKWIDYKKSQFNFQYRSLITEQTALSKLVKLANNDEDTALQIMEQSIANGWKGFFKIKEERNNKPSADYVENLKRRLQ